MTAESAAIAHDIIKIKLFDVFLKVIVQNLFSAKVTKISADTLIFIRPIGEKSTPCSFLILQRLQILHMGDLVWQWNSSYQIIT